MRKLKDNGNQPDGGTQIEGRKRNIETKGGVGREERVNKNESAPPHPNPNKKD